MNVRVILVPYDSGHCRKRMGLGPERILDQGLKKLLPKMQIQFDTVEIGLDNSHPAEISTAFELARKVSEKVSECRAEGLFPLVLSGNCNASLGTVSGCGAEKTSIIWFDAHGEANTPETTVSGFLDGMPLSILLGRAWQTLARSVPRFAAIPGKRIVLFGASQLENAECKLLDEAGVRRVSTVPQLQTALSALAEEADQIYVHLDLDVLNSEEAGWNQWAGPSGISVVTLLEAVGEIGNRGTMCALGMASYDPAADPSLKAMSAAVLAIQTLFEKM